MDYFDDKVGVKGKSQSSSEQAEDVINARAIITCPTCNYKKSFRNQYRRDKLELMVVTLKVFDWMVCVKCGDLLRLDLEFEI